MLGPPSRVVISTRRLPVTAIEAMFLTRGYSQRREMRRSVVLLATRSIP